MLRMFVFILALSPMLVIGQGLNKYKYDETGKLSASYTGKDKGNYSFVQYHANGFKSSTGHFKNGEKHGVWKTWDENGKLTAVARYALGEKTGKWIIKDEMAHTTFEISFNHNHMIRAW